MALPKDPKALRDLWRQEERLKTKAQRFNPEEGELPSDYQDDESKTDWEKLSATAELTFPSHLSAKFRLTPIQKTAAIAVTLGWTQQKIADACGRSISTVSKWFAKEEMKAFQKALSYHTGTQDAKEMLDKEMYATLQTMIALRDDPLSSPQVRMSAAQWIWEQKYGKAKETRENKSTISLRDLTEAIRSKPQPTAEDFIPTPTKSTN